MCTGDGEVANAAGNGCEQCADGKRVNSESLSSDWARVSRSSLLSQKDTCETCEEGKFSNAADTSHMSCDDCNPGKFSEEGAATCTTCPAGRWSGAAQGDECNECEAGKTSEAGAVNCIECASGKFSKGENCRELTKKSNPDKTNVNPAHSQAQPTRNLTPLASFARPESTPVEALKIATIAVLDRPRLASTRAVSLSLTMTPPW
jgi:hypothetical protein